MGIPNKDEIKGKAEQVKGAVKENVGHAINDRDMEQSGKADRAQGQVNEKVGEARRKVGEAVSDVGKAIGR